MMGPCNRLRKHHMGHLPWGSYAKDRVLGVFSAKTIWYRHHMVPYGTGGETIWFEHHMVPYGTHTICCDGVQTVPEGEPYGFDSIWYHMVLLPYGFCRKSTWNTVFCTIWYTIWYHMVSKPYGSRCGTRINSRFQPPGHRTRTTRQVAMWFPGEQRRKHQNDWASRTIRSPNHLVLRGTLGRRPC